MREKICAMLVALVVFVLGGLTVFAIANMPKEVSSREFVTNVTVDRTYHRGSYLTPIKAGKVTTYVTHSAQYKVYVVYENEEYMIDERDAYNYCKDKDGKVVQAIMTCITYDNGSTRYKLLDIVTE